MNEHFEIGDLVVPLSGDEPQEIVGFSRSGEIAHTRYHDGAMRWCLIERLTHYRPSPEQVAHEKALEAVDNYASLLSANAGCKTSTSHYRNSRIYAVVHAAVLDVMADE